MSKKIVLILSGAICPERSAWDAHPVVSSNKHTQLRHHALPRIGEPVITQTCADHGLVHSRADIVARPEFCL